MRRERRFAFLLLGAFVATAHAAEAPRFAYAYPLSTPPGANAYLVTLPQDAYGWAVRDGGLADVIVVDADERPVAMGSYKPALPNSHPLTVNLPLRAVPAVADGAGGPRIQRSTNGDIVIEPGAAAVSGAPREWLFDARAAVAAERLEFPAAGRDASLSVDIDGSANLQDWTPIARNVSVVTLGQGDDAVDARVVKLAASPWRYYRLRVDRGEAPWGTNGGSTVTLSGTVVDASTKDEADLRWLDVAATGETASGQGVDYDFRLPAALPLSRVRATLGAGDNVARLDVASVDGPMTGESLGTIVVTPGQEAQHALEVAPNRREHLRVHTATPLRAAPRLAVGWRPDRFVFLPEGRPPYRLLVGSRTGRRPNWPIDDAIAALRKSDGHDWRPAIAAVGVGEERDGRAAVDAPAAAFDWTRPLLWVVLLLGAAVVIGMAASLLRKGR